MKSDFLRWVKTLTALLFLLITYIPLNVAV